MKKIINYHNIMSDVELLRAMAAISNAGDLSFHDWVLFVRPCRECFGHICVHHINMAENREYCLCGNKLKLGLEVLMYSPKNKYYMVCADCAHILKKRLGESYIEYGKNF